MYIYIEISNCHDLYHLTFLKAPARVAKNRGAWEPSSHEVKTCRTNCDPGCKKYYRRKNICSETNTQNVQNENIYRCVTCIYIYIVVRHKTK